jgi:hypothetical protein
MPMAHLPPIIPSAPAPPDHNLGLSKSPVAFSQSILQGPIAQPPQNVPQFRLISASNPPNTTNTGPFRSPRYLKTATAVSPIGTSTATPTFLCAQPIRMPNKLGPFRVLASYTYNWSESTAVAATMTTMVSDGFTTFAVSKTNATGVSYAETSSNMYDAGQSVVFTLQSYASNATATYTASAIRLNIAILPA